MRKRTTGNHLTDDQLVAHIDGELDRREDELVGRHLKECWHCRSRASAFADQMRLLAEERDSHVFPDSREVDQARREFFARFDEMVPEKSPPSRPLMFPAPARLWVPAVAFGVLVIAVAAVLLGPDWIQRHRLPPSGDVLAAIEQSETGLQSAPDYLHQSILVEVVENGPNSERRRGELDVWADPAGRRYSSRWRDETGQLRYAVWRTAAGKDFAFDARSPAGVAPASPETSRQVALAELWRYGLDAGRVEDALLEWLRHRRWEPVLFAADFRAFVDGEGAAVKVARLPSSSGPPVIQLSAARVIDGVLVKFVLEADADSYRPRLQYITFERGGRHAEVRLLARRMERLPAVKWLAAVFEPDIPLRRKAISSPPPSAPAPVVRAVPEPVPAQAQLDAAEVEARYILHRLGACLGEPIRIERNASRINIRGIADSPERRRQIVAALAEVEEPTLVSVAIRTVDEALASEQDRPAPPAGGLLSREPLRVSESRFPLRGRLLEYFRGSGQPGAPEWQVTSFVNSALEVTSQTLDEAWALRRLAERYPLPEVRRLPPQSRWLVEIMVRGHLNGLRRDAETARTLLEPVFSPIAGPRNITLAPSPGLPADLVWNEAALALFSRVRQMHDVVHGLLGGGGCPLVWRIPAPGRPAPKRLSWSCWRLCRLLTTRRARPNHSRHRICPLLPITPPKRASLINQNELHPIGQVGFRRPPTPSTPCQSIARAARLTNDRGSIE